MQGCVPDDELEQYHAGQMPADQAARVKSHLEACPACNRRSAARVEAEQDLIHELRDIGTDAIAELDAVSAADAAARAPQPAEPCADAQGRPGLEIAGYDVVGELHRGGQGVVYRAIQEHTKREVAIKVLLEGTYASPATKRRFEREIELAAQLRHPHIVAVFHSGLTGDGRQYCVMDYVRGLPLNQHVRQKALSLEDALELLATVCDAVMYAHQRAIIHRDLKPSNILVDESGAPKVLDFGLAKQTHGSADTVVTLSGQVFGTVPYMSPEQTRGCPEEIDTRADIYALGVILYQLLTGEYPYPVDGPIGEALQHIATTPPTPPSRAWTPEAGVSGGSSGSPRSTRCPINQEVQTIILTALAKEPERRYQTAGELAADIRHYLAGEPIAAKRTSHWYVMRKTIRRYKLSFAIAAAFVVLATGSSIALSIMYSRQAGLLAEVQLERDRASHRFEQVRRLARSFIYDFHFQIAGLKGAMPARQFLVTTALEYLDNLAQEASDDPSLMRELASAYEYVGDVQGNPNQANLGDTTGALRSYERSLEIVRAIVQAEPGNSQFRRSLSIVRQKIGDVQQALGKTSDALASYVEAREVVAALVRDEPSALLLQRDLCVSRDKVGDALRSLGRKEQALASYRTALAGREALAGANPADADLQRDLFVSYVKVANIERDSGLAGAALGRYQKAALIAEALARARTNQVRAQRDVYIIHSQIGYTQMELGRLAAAITSYEECIRQAMAIVESDPQDRRAKADLALGNNLLGEAQAEAGHSALAIETYRRAQAAWEDLAAGDPQNVFMRVNLASAHDQIGLVLAETGQADAGLASCLKGHELFASVAQADPQNARYQRDLAESCRDVGRIHMRIASDTTTPADAKLESWQEASSWLQRSRDAFVAMRAAGTFFESDAGLFESIKSDLAKCDAAIAELR